mmetsp:Transcript_4715/g.17438  ORF Transcript_4715/g.17438 Transcript_4715/m.17438 type:complete len:342 (-) Transcript_4715:461-1486(-)
MRLGDLVQVLHVPDLRAGKFVDDEIFLVVVPATRLAASRVFVLGQLRTLLVVFVYRAVLFPAPKNRVLGPVRGSFQFLHELMQLRVRARTEVDFRHALKRFPGWRLNRGQVFFRGVSSTSRLGRGSSNFRLDFTRFRLYTRYAFGFRRFRVFVFNHVHGEIARHVERPRIHHTRLNQRIPNRGSVRFQFVFQRQCLVQFVVQRNRGGRADRVVGWFLFSLRKVTFYFYFVLRIPRTAPQSALAFVLQLRRFVSHFNLYVGFVGCNSFLFLPRQRGAQQGKRLPRSGGRFDEGVLLFRQRGEDFRHRDLLRDVRCQTFGEVHQHALHRRARAWWTHRRYGVR